MANPPIESDNRWTKANLVALAQTRKEDRSFHVFSEQYMRGQIFNFGVGERLGWIECEGNILITAIEGTIEIQLVEGQKVIEPFCQMLINPQVRFAIIAQTEAAFQVIWSPPFAKVTKLE